MIWVLCAVLRGGTLGVVLGHYLPQMYLNRFTSGGRLFVFDRKTGKLRRDGVRSVAAISDYYVLATPTGDRDESVERGFLADLETAAAPALERLGRCEAISDREHGVLAVFLAILCTRVPAFEKSHAQLNDQLGKITFRHLAGTPSSAADFLARRRRTLPYTPRGTCRTLRASTATSCTRSKKRELAVHRAA
jgi:Protein of unknown function (DUF4238)